MDDAQIATDCAAALPEPADGSGGIGPPRAQDDLLQLLECSDVTVAFLHVDLRIRRISTAARRLLRLDPRLPTQTLGDLAQWIQCPDLSSSARQALDTGTSAPLSLQLPRSDTHLMASFHLSRSGNGETNGLLLRFVDTTERWKANSVSGHLAAIVRYSDDAILSKDLNGVITTWNRGAQRLFGYTADETIGKPVTILIPEGMPDEEPGILERVRRGEVIDHYQTVRKRKDGELIDISLCVSPVRDADGRIVGASKIARDITQEKHAERLHEVLINELNHRVKNTLATVQSIAYQSIRYADSMDAFAESFNARLRTLSKTHDLLTSGNWLTAPLRDLVLNELAPYRNEANVINLTGASVKLQPRKVLAFGMMVHELTTNAVKYGSLSKPGGQVHVSWEKDSTRTPPRLKFFWVESGGPPITMAPARKGMGSRLLETLAVGLGGAAHLDYAPAGLHYSIDVPLKSEESHT